MDRCWDHIDRQNQELLINRAIGRSREYMNLCPNQSTLDNQLDLRLFAELICSLRTLDLRLVHTDHQTQEFWLSRVFDHNIDFKNPILHHTSSLCQLYLHLATVCQLLWDELFRDELLEHFDRARLCDKILLQLIELSN